MDVDQMNMEVNKMEIKSLKLIYFSPTRTTKRVLDGIAQGIQADTVDHFDLTPPEAQTKHLDDIHDGFAVIGVPVYSGRVPVVAANRLKRIKADGTPAVIVVLYGNREYEDALFELRDLAVEAGFTPVAAGAFIGEHSFANEITPIAVGRPDSADIKKANEFGAMVREKMKALNAADAIPLLQVPGNSPYRERKSRAGISPVSQEDLCTLCGTCATVCPTSAITVNDEVLTHVGSCIICCACIKNCPTQARIMEAQPIKDIAKWLMENYSGRKEPEMYFHGG